MERPGGGHEVRHLTACGPVRVTAIRINQSGAEEYRRFIASDEAISEYDVWASPGEFYLPAPEGQSILYDPLHDEVIATFVNSHALLIFFGATGFTTPSPGAGPISTSSGAAAMNTEPAAPSTASSSTTATCRSRRHRPAAPAAKKAHRRRLSMTAPCKRV